MKKELIPTKPPAESQELSVYQRAMTQALLRSKADNTVETYQYSVIQYQKQGGVIPATPLQIAQWCEIAHAEDGTLYKIATIQTYLAAIAAAHVALGFPNPCADPLVNQTIKALKKERGTAQKQARALLIDDISRMCNTRNDIDNQVMDIRDRALLLVGWVCALRRAELVNIRFEHLRLLPDGYELTIPSSKTDKAGEGWKLPIPYAKKFAHCPVKALQTWIRTLGEQGFDGGYIFRPVNKGQGIGSSGLTPNAVDYVVKRRAQLARLKPIINLAGKRDLAVSAHSLRSGFITQGALNKLPDWMLQATSRHSSVDMLHRYIRAARLFEDSAAGKML